MSGDTMRKTISQNFLMVNKTLIQQLGPCSSMLLSLLIDKETYWNSTIPNFDGWFFKLAEEIESELGLSDHDRRLCTKKLESMGLIYTKRIGVPSKLHYKIDYAAVEALIVSGKLVQIEPSKDDQEKACNISSDLNLRPLDLENLDHKRSKISTSITKTPDTKTPPTQGSLRGDFENSKETASSEKPSVDQIRRSWELTVGNYPAQQDRLPLLRDLMTTLKSFNYTESHLPRNMGEVVTAHWWSKAKDKKQKEAMRERSLKDYDSALVDLSEIIEIASAPKMKNKAQKKPKVANENALASLDALIDQIDQGLLDETEEFYLQMLALAEKE